MKDDWKEYVKNDKWKQFKKYCEINSTHPYNIICVLGVHSVLRYLEWGDLVFRPDQPWMKDRKPLKPEKAYHKGLKVLDGYGISISQANFILQSSAYYAKTRGEELRKWWNKSHGGTGEEKDTIVSNMFTIDVSKLGK